MIWILVASIWCGLSYGVFSLLKHRYDALIPLPIREEMDGNPPSVAVIIPARNEAENIGPCLESLTRQDYSQGALRIVVVDDGSSDDTALIARQFEAGAVAVRVVTAGGLPDGWLGKSHACWVGAQAAQADFLCFIDADTRHAPELVLSALSKALADGIDLLSLHPRQDMFGFWERLLMPISFMSLMILLDAHKINDPNSKAAMANGQFILIKKEVYETVGGHAAVHDEVLEDVALGRLAKSAGYSLKVFAGERLIRTRMYHRLKELWEGLARGGSELFGIPLTCLAVLASILGTFLPIAFPLWRLAVAVGEPGWIASFSAVLAILGSLIWYRAHALAFHQYHVPYTYLFLIPISNLLIAAVNVEGVIRRLLGLRRWKDRTI